MATQVKVKKSMNMKFLHKRSEKNNSIPSPENLEYGELAINYFEGGEKLFIKNSNDEIVGLNFANKNIITREAIADEIGMVIIEEIDDYNFLNAVAFNNNQPLNVIRFGDNIYIGYYGGATIPSASSPTDLLFTAIPNAIVTVYYISKQ